MLADYLTIEAICMHWTVSGCDLPRPNSTQQRKPLVSIRLLRWNVSP
jgi:hypothetical protein